MRPVWKVRSSIPTRTSSRVKPNLARFMFCLLALSSADIAIAASDQIATDCQTLHATKEKALAAFETAGFAPIGANTAPRFVEVLTPWEALTLVKTNQVPDTMSKSEQAAVWNRIEDATRAFSHTLAETRGRFGKFHFLSDGRSVIELSIVSETEAEDQGKFVNPSTYCLIKFSQQDAPWASRFGTLQATDDGWRLISKLEQSTTGPITVLRSLSQINDKQFEKTFGRSIGTQMQLMIRAEGRTQ